MNAALWLLGGLGMQVPAGCVAADGGEALRAPPLIWWTREAVSGREVRCFLPPLYRQVQEDEGRTARTNLLWPLYSFSRDSEPSGAGADYYDVRANVLWFLFSIRSDNYGEGRTRVQFLWPLGSYFRGELASRGEMRKVRSFRFLPLVHYERSWRREFPPPGLAVRLGEPPASTPPDSPRPDERVHLRVLHIGFGCDMDAQSGRQRCYILGAAPVAEDGTRTTFGAMAFERGPRTDYELQLLWRAFLFKRWGSSPACGSSTVPGVEPSDLWRALGRLWGGPPRVLVRLGPVFSWESDREADRSRWSILAGLFSMERKGSSRWGRVLWLVPWYSGPR